MTTQWKRKKVFFFFVPHKTISYPRWCRCFSFYWNWLHVNQNEISTVFAGCWSPLNLLWAQKYWKIYVFLLISFWQISYDDFKIILRILLFLYHKWSKKSIPPRRSNFIWITKVSIIFLQHCGRSEVFLSIYKYNLCRCELGTLIFLSLLY